MEVQQNNINTSWASKQIMVKQQHTNALEGVFPLLEIHEHLQVHGPMSHTNILSSEYYWTTNSMTLSKKNYFLLDVSVHKHGNGSSYTAIFTLVKVARILEENLRFVCAVFQKNKE